MILTMLMLMPMPMLMLMLMLMMMMKVVMVNALLLSVISAMSQCWWNHAVQV